MTQAQALSSKNLVTIHENAPLADAEMLMNNYNIRHLPVVDQNHTLVGILSKSDFIALKFIDSRLIDFTVKTFMTTPIVVVSKKTSIQKIAQIFMDKKINSVLVGDQHEITGILTSEDLIRLIAEKDEYFNEDQLDLSALSEEGWISLTQLA